SGGEDRAPARASRTGRGREALIGFLDQGFRRRLLSEDVEDVAAADVAGRVDRLRQLLDLDALRPDLFEPVVLDPLELARGEAEPAVVAEERVEVLERRVGLDQRAGPVLHEATELEADDATRAIRFAVLVEGLLQHAAQMADVLVVL